MKMAKELLLTIFSPLFHRLLAQIRNGRKDNFTIS